MGIVKRISLLFENSINNHLFYLISNLNSILLNTYKINDSELHSNYFIFNSMLICYKKIKTELLSLNKLIIHSKGKVLNALVERDVINHPETHLGIAVPFYQVCLTNYGV
ncbi:hypothetical protein L0B53_14055 [Vibrio sp. SS-MA-C1-2]|uniref:hypothetical protein n=1 Tax=Vibrio sp. SS-MA-C1-2 TaxID=2908646 RepID=UPI001F3CB454|nr:hypothetical protein [Vibrio sp. SS-MA-C1-2]UJF18135.1 hypothetical protein L0B53_14055 [Vibrio sp. SS-MA-C1-2]